VSLFDISNMVIAVTGSTGVLAGATADYLAKEGASVVYLGRSQEKLDKALDSVSAYSDKCSGFVCDVLDKPSLQEALKGILLKYGKIDALVNGAGGNLPGATIAENQTIFDLDMDDYDKVLDLNLKGTVLPTLVFAKEFANQKSGVVVNFSSMASPLAITRVVGYSNAKAAVDNFTKWLAMETALKFGDKIRVNAIAPGFFVANQNRAILINEDGSYTERGKKILSNTPFNRFGDSSEIPGVIHFLLSDAASFVTGAVLPVDGGFSSFSGV